jgi:multiple sugar transport system ATP-binding protein
MASVKLDGVRKVYENGFTAVHNVSLEVGDGEFVVLVGPSGCGKSTTLRMVAGLESISEGRLWIGDRLVNDVAPKDRDIAMVFQSYALYPHMTVAENLGFGLRLRGVARHDIDVRVREAASTLGLEGVLDRRPRELSGGQRQRVAVGRAIVRQPQVFLFDEPLSNLDAKLRVQTRKEIARLHQRLAATMIYVTHDQVEAMTLGERIVVMHEGKVQQIDSPLALYHNPANRFVAGFIGSPAMNFLEGRLLQEDGLRFRTEDGALSFPLAVRVPGPIGRALTLGIRPEDLRIDTSNGTASAACTLELVEPMGNELFAYVRAGSHELVARVPPVQLPDPPASVHLTIDPGRIHFFDPETQARLQHV